jgi:hypothetical protein
MSRTRSTALGMNVLAALLVAIGAGAGHLRAADDKGETFTAFAVNLSNVGTGRNGRVDITIDRWSTEEEREQLRTVLIERGTEALFRELQKMKPVGRIRVNDSLGWDLRYSRDVTSGGTRRIVFATDRPISTREAIQQPRSIDYKFTIGELKIGPDGKGQGTLSVAVKAKYDPKDRVLELENFASEPVRLQEVKQVK